jgi:hypothetical protein
LSIARDLRTETRRRGLAVDELAAKIISTLSGESLYDAVLGRVGERVEKRLPRRS